LQNRAQIECTPTRHLVAHALLPLVEIVSSASRETLIESYGLDDSCCYIRR